MKAIKNSGERDFLCKDCLRMYKRNKAREYRLRKRATNAEGDTQ